MENNIIVRRTVIKLPDNKFSVNMLCKKGESWVLCDSITIHNPDDISGIAKIFELNIK